MLGGMQNANGSGTNAGMHDHGRTIMGHPPGLFLLFMVEMWERFSFYGMRAILGLYLKCKLTGIEPLPPGAQPGFNPGRGWEQAEASNLVGWYGGMAYLLPVFGGLIADKFIGTHRSMVVGGLLITLGHLMLGVSGLGGMGTSDVGMSVFVTGLALIVIGTGHFKPSVSVMVNQLYPEGDKRREGAFGIFYMGINLGALLGGAAVGYVGERIGWHWGFSLAAVGMLAGLVQYTYFRRRYLGGIGVAPVLAPGQGWRERTGPWFFLAGVIAASGVGVAYHLGALGAIDGFISQSRVFWTLIGGGLGWALVFTLKQPRGDRGPVASIFIFMLFNFLFWLAFEQASTSVNFFTDDRIDRNLGAFAVPTSWFQNINPLVIILLSPIFGAMWVTLAQKKIAVPQPVKIGLGLIWLGLGYVFMVIAGLQIKGDGLLASMWLLVATYVLHTIGELFLSPTGLAYVTRAAPKSSTSLLMGVWFLSSFLANTVGGKVAGEADPATIAQSRFFVQDIGLDMGAPFANFFLQFVVLTVGGGIVIIALTPLLRRLMRDPND